jgi:GMP synthase (glutamine-hydrolysing)
MMREGETEYVQDVFTQLGAKAFHVEPAAAEFVRALEGVCDPERKRHIIGEQFVLVQERILNSGHFLEGNWILGQGTIYPDTIESGGTAKADLIKTHHNRVAGVQKLIEAGRIVEPLTSFYKDEVREIGRQLGIPSEFLKRHPFPGPGLGIRCLCSNTNLAIERTPQGWLIPVRSVGVQGDSRTYKPILLVDQRPSEESVQHATRLTNELFNVNRVVSNVASRIAPECLEVTTGFITSERLARLRQADAVVRAHTGKSGFDEDVWQFPVVLIPVGDGHAPDSVVLRPIHSVDGMTAEVVLMPSKLLSGIAGELLEIEGIAAVFYDLTHKPPGTIEWE